MKFSFDKSLEILQSTPNVISAMLNGLSDEWTTNNEGENTWTAKEVVAHLIVCEQTYWLPRVKIILYSPEVIFTPIDMQAHFVIANKNSVPGLVNEFKEERRQSLQGLISLGLSETDFVRTGLHPKCGSVSIQQLIATWVVHDMTHVAQIARVIARQNKELVGSFKQYLKILSD